MEMNEDNTMRANGPYPILVLQGEAGSGKSQAARMLKALLDPAPVAFQPLPGNPNTLLRQASQTWNPGVRSRDLPVQEGLGGHVPPLDRRGFQPAGRRIPDHDQPRPPDHNDDPDQCLRRSLEAYRRLVGPHAHSKACGRSEYCVQELTRRTSAIGSDVPNEQDRL